MRSLVWSEIPLKQKLKGGIVEERLKIVDMIGKLADSDSLKREKQDRVPISNEEDYLLTEIQRLEGLPTRAKTWRFLLGRYGDIAFAQAVLTAFSKKNDAEADLNNLKSKG